MKPILIQTGKSTAWVDDLKKISDKLNQEEDALFKSYERSHNLNTELLKSLGWIEGRQKFFTCRRCGLRSEGWGWYSPKGAFYHSACLERTERYKKLLREDHK